jgi:hypothetical protein
MKNLFMTGFVVATCSHCFASCAFPFPRLPITSPAQDRGLLFWLSFLSSVDQNKTQRLSQVVLTSSMDLQILNKVL